MRVKQLISILRGYPQDWQVEMAVVAYVDEVDVGIPVDRYSIERVLPRKEGDEELLWLVGGEEDNVAALLAEVEG
jgi:hypothetical protein